jgi:hypothetical protein
LNLPTHLVLQPSPKPPTEPEPMPHQTPSAPTASGKHFRNHGR